MKKTIKIVFLVLISIIFLYALFITEESVRLSHNKYAKPLIVFTKTYSGPNRDVTYKSLGFKLKNMYACPNDLCYVTEQTFYVFDSFILWAWIS